MRSDYFWKDSEIAILKKFGSTLTAKEIQKKIPHKSWVAINHKRKLLGIEAPGVAVKWTNHELSILKKYGHSLTAKELQKKIPRKNIILINRKRKKLNIPAPKNKKIAKPEEIKIIKENIDLLDKEIAKKLKNRSKSFVQETRIKLGLIKNNKYKPLPKEFKTWWDRSKNNNIEFSKFSYSSTNEKEITLACPLNKKHLVTKKIIRFIETFKRHKTLKCDFCEGLKVHAADSMEKKFPKLSKAIIQDKRIKTKEIWYKSTKKYLFKCKNGHENNHHIKNLTHKKNKVVQDFFYETICLKCKYPCVLDSNIFKPYLDMKKNRLSELKKIHTNEIKKKIWLKCLKKNHSWQVTPAYVNDRAKGQNNYDIKCNVCLGLEVRNDNSLWKKLQNSSLFFDKSKNNSDPKKIYYYSGDTFVFTCKKRGHSFKKKASAIYEKRKGKPVCRICETLEASLKFKNPNLFNEIDYDKSKNIESIPVSSHRKIWWRCLENPDHPSWLTSVVNRTQGGSNCRLCDNVNSRGIVWDKETARLFLKSIRDHIHSLTPAEKFLIFQQTGMPSKSSSSYKFIKDFASGKIPVDEIDKFIEGKNNSIDSTIVNIEIEEAQISNDDVSIKPSGQAAKETIQIINEPNVEQGDDKNFPEVSTKQVLKTLSYLVRNVNQEAIEFLIASAKHKIWRDVFQNEAKAIKQLKQYSNDEYVKRVQFEFLNEYKRAIKIKEPKGYSFKYPPKLMQKLTAAKIIHERRVGNWSGTGAGKTLSAILASRCVGSKNTVVCCPNALAQDMKAGWGFEIMNIFPDSNVRLKSFEPLDTKSNNYYVLNYEAFQQKNSSKKILEFLKKVKVDFVIIDEIHYSKQRQVENLSERKKNITSMLAEIQKKNKKLHVLGMSATPVINNLFEGRSLVEMITGEVHKDLPTKVNINNCMKLHQKLTTVGLRYMPDYKMKLKTTIEDIDCSHITDQVKELGKHPTPLELEKLLTREKISTIKKYVEPKTLIYTHYLDDIADYIKEELEKDGYKVGFFTGEDKSGLDEFKNGSLDILIGSRTVGTGVNGLQDVCRKIIINSLPWTNAEYEQLIGRVYREGQKRDVEIVIPLTEGTVNGQQWSWCKSRYDRIKFKKTVGDAAVDGVIPSEEIRTESQVLQDLMKWIERISGDDDFEIKREPIKSEFVFDSSDEQKRIAKYGDFSRMNREWNNSKSITTHEKIKKNPDLWKHYHQMFEENKKKWTVVPTTELVKFFKSREGYEIGDFGCGKAILHEQLSSKHTIHSFDHYACNQYVTACDISKTTLNDKQLDFAVFSLSMMGSNIADYITEANRTLKLDGGLFIIEATSRFKDLDQFKRQLIQFGFDYLSVKEMGKFTQIKADKVKDIDLKNNLELKF